MPGSLLKFEKKYSVKIDGRRYPAVKIGNQLWMAENLDYKWTGLLINNTTDTGSGIRGYYWNYDESSYGWNGERRGIYYNWNAMHELALHPSNYFPEGWKIPLKTDYETLVQACGSDAVNALRSTAKWSKNGTNTSGFNAYPYGRNFGTLFSEETNNTWFWFDAPAMNNQNALQLNDNYYSNPVIIYDALNGSARRGLSIRLVKTLT